MTNILLGVLRLLRLSIFVTGIEGMMLCQLLLNKKLMDLTDSVMGGSSRQKTQHITGEPIQRLVKHKFQRMFLEDKLYTALPNLDSWLHSTFNRLNHMAEKSHG